MIEMNSTAVFFTILGAVLLFLAVLDRLEPKDGDDGVPPLVRAALMHEIKEVVRARRAEEDKKSIIEKWLS